MGSNADDEIVLAEPGSEAFAFLRCAVCQGDNNRFAVECRWCGARLDTEEQRAFNEKLRAQLEAEKRRENEALARVEAEKEAARLEESRRGEEMRIDPPGREAASNGLALISLIPNPRTRRWALLGTGAALLGLPALVVLVPGTGVWKAFAILASVVGWWQFLPIGWTRRHWRWLLLPAAILLVVSIRTLPVFDQGAVEGSHDFAKRLVGGLALLAVSEFVALLAWDGWRNGQANSR